MKRIITYGTFDLLHYGHIRLLERAKALGDYLIVGVTSNDFDKSRGKINVSQSLMERVEAVKATGIADEIIIEEYEGQKIDDIIRYNVDIFAIGSDWEGKFDYLNEYCDVVYLDRTIGVSSTQLRSDKFKINMGVVGEYSIFNKFIRESQYVNGVDVTYACTKDKKYVDSIYHDSIKIINDYDEMLNNVDAVYIVSHPTKHFEQVKKALLKRKHVICESPIALKEAECIELFYLAEKNKCILMDGIKTAYSTAYYRLQLLVKSGQIGDIVSIDATCTSLKNLDIINDDFFDLEWNSLCDWGPTALLPVFQILGTNYNQKLIVSHFINEEKKFDSFTNINLIYDNSIASVKIGKGVKSEDEMIISGTKGYIYVPAPWWKTDYFRIRFENSHDNKRYFYQLEGEGIRFEIISFLESIKNKKIISI